MAVQQLQYSGLFSVHFGLFSSSGYSESRNKDFNLKKKSLVTYLYVHWFLSLNFKFFKEEVIEMFKCELFITRYLEHKVLFSLF